MNARGLWSASRALADVLAVQDHIETEWPTMGDIDL